MKRHLLCLVWAISVLTAPVSSRAAPGAHGPNGEHLDMPASAAPGGLARLPDGSVSVPMPAQRRMGLRTVLAEMTTSRPAVELPARVFAHPRASAWVQSMQGGRVQAPEGGLPLAGQAVRKGQLLARVESKGSSSEPLLAPMTGTLASARVHTGQVVAAAELLYEIMDEQHLLVRARTADVTLPTRLHQAFLREAPQARLTLESNARVLQEGLLPLDFSVHQQEGFAALAVGQSVTLIAQLDVPQQGYVLPAQALVRNAANETVVWIKSGTQRYIAQPVRAQPLDATSVLITDGLGPDNRVVVQGAALLAQIR